MGTPVKFWGCTGAPSDTPSPGQAPVTDPFWFFCCVKAKLSQSWINIFFSFGSYICSVIYPTLNISSLHCRNGCSSQRKVSFPSKSLFVGAVLVCFFCHLWRCLLLFPKWGDVLRCSKGRAEIQIKKIWRVLAETVHQIESNLQKKLCSTANRSFWCN